MATYGISPTGFYAKPLSVIDDEVDEDLRGILGDSAGTEEDGKIPAASLAGQLKALLVDIFAAQWDLQQSVCASFDPAKATGRQQDALCSITGTVRSVPRLTVATGTCIGTPGTALDVGRVATVEGTNSRLISATGVNLATGVAYTPSGTYVAGDLRYIPGQNRYYQCIFHGAGNGSGPSGTGSDITAGDAEWKFLGEGIGIANTPFYAERTGPLGVATGALSTIATPVNGWNAVTNLLQGVAGSNRETDAALRVRREQELATTGNTTVDAIRANILQVNQGSTDPNHEPADSCSVFFNDTDSTDANGVPPHSVEALVYGGTTQDIAQAIWDSVGAGTRTYGNRSDTVLDSEGNNQTVNWSRPTEVQIWVYATGRYQASEWPDGSDSVVAQAMLSALLTSTASWPPSRDVRTSPLNAAFMRGPAGTTGGIAIVPADPSSDPVTGLLEVDPLYISTASGVTGTTQISIGTRQIAVFDASRCFITATTEDP